MNFEEDSSDGGNYNAPLKDFDSSSGGGKLERLQKLNGNLLLLFAFALVTIADAIVQADNASQIEDGDLEIDPSPAIAVSAASLLITLLRYGHSLCVEDELSPGFQVGVSVVLLIIWVAGVIVLTFQDGGTFANNISSGFFSAWACLLIAGTYVMSTAAQANSEGSCNPQACCCGLDIKKGVTGSVGISLILCLTVVIITSGESGIGGILGMILSILVLIVLTTMICIPYEKYGNLDKFTFIVILITGLSFGVVLLTTLGEPFALRPVEGGPLELDGNGYFSVVGLFLSLVIMLWNSHVFILYFNRDEGGNFGIQGRYIWGSLLGGTGIVALASGVIECGNFGGCGENDFLLPMVALGAGTTALTIALYCVGKENIDNGDDQILSPGSGFDFFDNNYQRLEFVGAFLLQVAWTAAAAAFTFAINSPFNTASNGFFFSWFGFFFASQYFSSIYPRFSFVKLSCLDWEPPNGMERKNNLGLGLGMFGVAVQFAAVMVGVAQKLINEEDIAIEDFAAFGTQVLTLISILVLLCTRPERLGQCAVVLAYLFLLTAYIQLIVTTIVLNPFDNNEGNGFFAAWVIMFGAFYNLNHYEWGLKEEDY